MKTKQLKVWGFRKWLGIKTIDLFKELTFDNVRVYLEIKENEGIKIAMISTNFQGIGYTKDISFAFKVFHNLSIYTLKELFNSRGSLEGIKG